MLVKSPTIAVVAGALGVVVEVDGGGEVVVVVDGTELGVPWDAVALRCFESAAMTVLAVGVNSDSAAAAAEAAAVAAAAAAAVASSCAWQGVQFRHCLVFDIYLSVSFAGHMAAQHAV